MRRWTIAHAVRTGIKAALGAAFFIAVLWGVTACAVSIRPPMEPFPGEREWHKEGGTYGWWI